DRNGIDDWFDIQSGTSVDANGNHIPDQCEAAACATCAGDVNGDARLDGRDIGAVVACVQMTGSMTPACVCCDINADGVIDVNDVNLIVAKLLGQSPGCP